MAKSKKRKPSFDSSDVAGAEKTASWVYRSDADARADAPAEPRKPRAGSASARVTQETPSGTAAPEPLAAGSTPVAPPVGSDRAKGAEALVDRYAKYAGALGLVPVPIVDFATIAAVQMAMLRALTAHYGVPFNRERGKRVIAALLGSVMPTLAGYQLTKVVGTLLGMITVSGFAVAATSALGALFIAHFESGGTLADIDVERSGQQLKAQLSRA